MERAAFLHRPDSEYAYLYTKDLMHIRLRTKRNDAERVELISGDPYLINEEKWHKESRPMKRVAQTEDYDYWLIERGAKYRRVQYAFAIHGYDGEDLFYGDRGIFELSDQARAKAENYFRMPYFHEADRFKEPEWVKETVWYQIFPERFDNGDQSNDPEGTLPWASKDPSTTDFFGGDLQGVIDHLDYIQELGINGLYFCPIFKATSNHKYDTIDYFEIDPAFGDKAKFKELVEKAHERGIKIMLDAVFNHFGNKSPQWQDVLENEEKSRFKDWFQIKEFPVQASDEDSRLDLNFDTFAFTPRMPKLNTANPEVIDYLLAIATYWIEEFDIDAWRLDVANEVDHRFWRKFYDATTGVKEDLYILGEIWHSSQSWLDGHEFHAVMNYAFTETIENFFVKKEIKATKLASGLHEQLMLYREQTNQVMFNCLDSHDTPRLLTTCGGDKELAKQTLAFTFIQQGSPCIYYGTEIGMDGAMDPDCRKCMIWDEEKQDLVFLDFMKDLIAFRKEQQKVLSYGTLTFEELDNENQFIQCSRSFEGQTIAGLFNAGNNEVEREFFGEVALSQNVDIVGKKAVIKKNGFLITKG
ncbi:glycoside hydrolase family 13 protein [Vagococcus silagei]|uniref:Alpha-glycosidase n=1 Tax=Vagococcus silagei TaxID=2508885 RepID=A0A4S3B2G5_9ENTE|nr:glycoside hydrolase family 13 protein [Vagococcus silagei]THB60427.1 alpha-glycosidase [Vagococcus silagei]